MRNVLMQPAGAEADEHFRQTLLNPVSKRMILDALDGTKRLRLEPALAGLDTIPVWGLEPNNNTSGIAAWRDLQAGDLAVFCGFELVRASGFVIAKVDSDALGAALYPPNGAVYRHVYMLDRLRSYGETIPWAEFRQRAQYENPRALPFNLRMLRDDRAQEIIAWLYPEEGAQDEFSPATQTTVEDVPIESHLTERMSVGPQAQREAERRESKLVKKFVDYAEANGKTAGRKRIIPKGAVKALYTDIYLPEPNLLMEAKGAPNRVNVRMAIGQLADYRRFLDSPRCAILLPEEPAEDLLDLAAAEEICVVWPFRSGFKSTTDLW